LHMKYKHSFMTLFTVFLLIVTEVTQAQHSVSLIPSQSKITISGTSNLHDWEEKVQMFNVSLNLKLSEEGIGSINGIQFNCRSGSIVSDNSIMTNKTHNALMVDKYPEITFKLVSVDNLSSSNGNFSGNLVGDITLAGVTKRISLSFAGVHTGNKITINGSKELNMNDFRIKPPTAMMGALKTGEQVTVSFQLNFQVS